MLSIFKTNSVILSILLIPYGFILRSFGFFRDIPSDFDNGGLLSDMVYETLGLNDMLLSIISFILVLLQALFLIIFTNKTKFTSDRNLYVGVFYVLFSSMSVYFLGLTPALMGNTFLLLAIANFYEIYKLKEPAGKNFNAGFWLAIAALFYGSLFLFFFFGLFAINLMRAFNIKEMLQFLSGYVVPFVFLFTYYYYIGDVNESYWAYLTSFFGVMDFKELPDTGDYISLSIFSILTLASIMMYGVIMDKQGMKTRKNINILFLFMLFAIGSVFIQAGVGMEHVIIMAIPLSILMGIIFSQIKKPVWAETWHLLLFIVIPISHYFFS